MRECTPSTTITTDGIMRICVKAGFYRNPVCNEKLYLHNKGFDSIEEGAFDPYTDVKVLWLEGNAFTVIHCGKDSQKSRPQEKVVSGSETEGQLVRSAAGGTASPATAVSKSAYVDCCADWLGRSETNPSEAEHCTGPESLAAKCENIAAEGMNAEMAVFHTSAGSTKGPFGDVFQSLYPTLRQLYLHNNALRHMPDLSLFQLLDAVNLSSNCIRSIEANCVYFNDKVTQYEEAMAKKIETIVENSKSMQRELSSADAASNLPGEKSSNSPKSPSTKLEGAEEGGDADKSGRGCDEGVANAADNVAVRETLEAWCSRVDAYTSFCPHQSLESLEGDEPLTEVPREYRNPCSSLRTLNLASNFLTTANDIVQLLCYKNLSVLDLSNNQLSDGEGVLLVLERLHRLKALKLSGNPLVRTIPRYRKTVLMRCSGLLHLDDRPVFDSERRLVTAWARGGDEAEKKERLLMKEEEKELHVRRLREFRETLGLAALRTARETETVRVPPRMVTAEPGSGQQGSGGAITRNINDGQANDDSELTSSETGEEIDGEDTTSGTAHIRHVAGGGLSSLSVRRQSGTETNGACRTDEDDDDDIFVPPRDPRR